jgi:hypothetical protein
MPKVVENPAAEAAASTVRYQKIKDIAVTGGTGYKHKKPAPIFVPFPYLTFPDHVIDRLDKTTKLTLKQDARSTFKWRSDVSDKGIDWKWNQPDIVFEEQGQDLISADFTTFIQQWGEPLAPQNNPHEDRLALCVCAHDQKCICAEDDLK